MPLWPERLQKVKSCTLCTKAHKRLQKTSCGFKVLRADLISKVHYSTIRCEKASPGGSRFNKPSVRPFDPTMSQSPPPVCPSAPSHLTLKEEATDQYV